VAGRRLRPTERVPAFTDRRIRSTDTVRLSARTLFFPGNREIFKKNREAIEHERAITERD
jgi:hypothetical protein